MASLPDHRPTLGYRGEITTDNLTYLRARHYLPAHSRFTTPDPLDGQTATPTATNPYPYAANDPNNKTDPTGLYPGPDDDGWWRYENPAPPIPVPNPGSRRPGRIGKETLRRDLDPWFPGFAFPSLAEEAFQVYLEAAESATGWDLEVKPVLGGADGRHNRIPDFRLGTILYEVKSGKQANSGNTRRQVGDDIALSAFYFVEWHFFPSIFNDYVSGPLRTRLVNGGIDVVLHKRRCVITGILCD